MELACDRSYPPWGWLLADRIPMELTPCNLPYSSAELSCPKAALKHPGCPEAIRMLSAGYPHYAVEKECRFLQNLMRSSLDPLGRAWGLSCLSLLVRVLSVSSPSLVCILSVSYLSHVCLLWSDLTHEKGSYAYFKMFVPGESGILGNLHFLKQYTGVYIYRERER